MTTPTIHSYQRCNATSDRTSAWFVYGESGAYLGERQWRPFAAVLRDEVESGPAYWIAIPGPAFPSPFPFTAAHAADLDADGEIPTGIGRTREAAVEALAKRMAPST